jgi:uncharacterized membrane protein
MRGFICSTNVTTNEEYRNVVKTRMKLFVAFIIFGIVTASVAFYAEMNMNVAINEHMLEVYAGVGVGLILVGTMLWIKNRRLLNNEEKLKESRLSNTDERILEISNKAFRVATYVMLIAVYGIALIGGLFYPELVQILLVLVSAFLLTYVIAFKYYNNKM